MNLRKNFPSFHLGFFLIYIFTITNVHGENLIINGDFNADNTGFTTDYQFPLIMQAGSYGIYSEGADTGFFGVAPSDHTTGTGFMFLANGAESNKLVWGQDVAVEENTIYDFSMWAMTLRVGSGTNSDLEIMINNSRVGSLFGTPFQDNSLWTNFKAQWDSNDNKIAKIRIFERSLEPNGNDFGLDDISLTAVTSTICELNKSAIVLPNLDIHLPSVTYQSLIEPIHLWVDLEFYGNDSNNLLWKLKDYGKNAIDCTPKESVIISPNLDIQLISINYQLLSGTLNLWANFEYYGQSSQGELLWKLLDYGENQ